MEPQDEFTLELMAEAGRLSNENLALKAELAIARETLRDKFAMAVLQGLITSGPNTFPPAIAAARSYQFADSMLGYRGTDRPSGAEMCEWEYVSLTKISTSCGAGPAGPSAGPCPFCQKPVVLKGLTMSGGNK